MKNRAIRSALFVGACLLTMLAISISGCTAGNPAVADDQSAVDAAQAKLAADQAIAATQPTTQATAQVSADQSAVVAAINKLDADTLAIKDQQVQSAGTAVTTVAQAAPFPWSTLAAIITPIAVGGIMAYMGKTHSTTVANLAAQTANSIPINQLPATVQPIVSATVAAINTASGGSSTPAKTSA